MLTKFLNLFSVGKLVVANWSGHLFFLNLQSRTFSVESAKKSSYLIFNNHWDLMAESLFKAEIASVGDEALEIRVGQQVLGR